MKTLLSISGGGMRGVIPGRILMEIEDKNGKPIHQIFDLIGGTSTGGILAILTGMGVPAWKALNFYYTSGPKIFSGGLRNSWTIGGLLSTKYTDENLSRELQKAIPPRELGESLTKIMVTTVKGDNSSEMLKSWDEWGGQWPAWQAAKATSSAQIYFPPTKYGSELYFDGGNVRNNPVACVLLEGIRLWPNESFRLISLGTGIEAKPRKLPTGGVLAWGAELFNTVNIADDSYDDYAVRQVANLIDLDYRRLDITIDRFPRLDDARRKTLDALVKETENLIHNNEDKLIL